MCCLAFVTIVRRFQRKRACKNGSFFRKQLIQLTRAQECNNKGWDENVRFSGSGPREHVDEVYFSHTWGTHSSAHASRVRLAVGLNRNDCYYGYSHVFVYVVKFVSMWVWQNFMIDGFVINDTIFFFYLPFFRLQPVCLGLNDTVPNWISDIFVSEIRP